jgi:LysR family transcriptional regulator, nitrogen assimilation regulatory protein
LHFRHLRYFVKIVEAGSFSRAAATIFVAQPALSQQIAELEEQLGVILLKRSARGVRPTAAGEILYREASAILRQVEQLPSIVRSSDGEAQGVVKFGMSSTLAATLAGTFIETCKSALPKVTLKFTVSDSQSIKAKIESQALDIAVVFEDELVPNFSRKPLFRQRLYLVCHQPLPKCTASILLSQIAKLPLILSGYPNVVRAVIDRAFAAAGLTPNVVAEADVMSSILSVVRTGIGNTILPKGDLSDIVGNDFAQPVLVEPPLFLTASIISSGDFPLTHAGEAVHGVLSKFVESHLRRTRAPGAEWIG